MTLNVEELVVRIGGRVNLRRLVQPLIRSEVAWRASGLTYATAVVATTGSFCSRHQYLENMANRMETFTPWFKPTDSVLEFGCGLGGNIIGVSPRIRRGYGVDINRLFVRSASRLGRLAGADNLSFVGYDGRLVPRLYPVDVVLSIGVFERLPKGLVVGYLSQLRRMLQPGGRMILYFLTDQAIERGFGRVLGRESYIGWQGDELERVFRELNLEVQVVLPRFLRAGDCYILRCPPITATPAVNQ